MGLSAADYAADSLPRNHAALAAGRSVIRSPAKGQGVHPGVRARYGF